MEDAIAGTVGELKPRLDPNSIIQFGENYYQVESVSDIGVRGYQLLEGGGFSQKPTTLSPDTPIVLLPGFGVSGKIER